MVKLRFELTPEEAEKINTALAKMIEDNTSLPGNKCHCGGQVTRKVSSYFRGRFYYRLPECESCHRIYFLACDAPTTGELEFMEILRQPPI
jgi:hypothetical protein